MIDFYKKSKFAAFFKNNEDYYSKAISKFNSRFLMKNYSIRLWFFIKQMKKNLEFVVFVELTNNANNKVVDFYEQYNPKKRARILANNCDSYDEPKDSNDALTLDNSIRVCCTIRHPTCLPINYSTKILAI